MEMIMSSSFNTAGAPASFWSGTHLGRQIATSQHGNGWVVYLDRIMLANRTFGCSQDAVRWLQRKVEDDEFDTRTSLFRPFRRVRARSARQCAA
jgi:hypothetical protein